MSHLIEGKVVRQTKVVFEEKKSKNQHATSIKEYVRGNSR